MKTQLTKERQKKIHGRNRLQISRAELDDRYWRGSRRMALTDSLGNIVAVNDAWAVFAKESGADMIRVGPGVNYLDVCRQAVESSGSTRTALAGLEAVLLGKSESFVMDYSCDTPSGPGYFRMNVTPLVYGNARVAIAHTDITDLQHSKEEDLRRLRQFARRLIKAQEEERQRISREIHDDLGHRIALLSFSVRQIIKQHSNEFASSTRDMNKILDGFSDFSTALRHLSHCLYPPPLQYLGIRPALNSLSSEFEKTSGIHVELVVPVEVPRLPADVELGIYRILQESLQNIAKHSGAEYVRIHFEKRPEEIRLTISDSGRGFDRTEARRKGGIGLLSMEERALSLGARLTVNSSPDAGTEIVLSLPFRQDLSAVTVE